MGAPEPAPDDDAFAPTAADYSHLKTIDDASQEDGRKPAAEARPAPVPPSQPAGPEPGGRLYRELAKLDTSYNRTLGVQEVSDDEEEPSSLFETATDYVFSASINSDPGTPKNDREAQKSAHWQDWKEGMWREFDNFIKRDAWQFMDRAELPEGARVLRTKNDYKLKTDPVDETKNYKLRNVILGYEQIPGVDYSESFAPLVTDVSVRITLALSLYHGERDEDWAEEMIDVEAAFLNSKLDTKMFIELPNFFAKYCDDKGITMPKDAVAKVIMSQYGLVQAAGLWFQKFVRILTDEGCKLEQCLLDPCVFYKHQGGNLVLLMVVYCDDAIMCGKQTVIDQVKLTIKKHIRITELGLPRRHLGVYYSQGRDEMGPYWEASMEKLAHEIVADYEKRVGHKIKIWLTPGMPGKVLTKYDGEAVNTSDYRSYVGRLLFPVKKCIPNCVNATRDLCGHLERPGPDQWKALERLMGHLKGHYKPLKIRCPRELRVVGNSDSDWATDQNDRKSISGNLSHIDRALVDFSSKKQTGIALSSTEAELISGSTECTTIKFVAQLMDEVLGQEKRLRPSQLHIDNEGAIHIQQNNAVTPRTKHVDICTRFVQKMVQDCDLEVFHVGTLDCHADIETKNLGDTLHEKHSDAVHEGRFVYVENTEASGKEDVESISKVCRIPD